MKRMLLLGPVVALGVGCTTPQPTGPFEYKYTNHGYTLQTPAPPAPPPPAPVVAKVDPCAPGQTHTPDQCPLLDDDGDGIPNGQDLCPLEKGIPELKGCPAKDSDGDGVPDHLDKCPNEPGPASNQGCPVRKAEITAGKIELKEAVFFDSGKATIQSRSDELLKDVAAILKNNPQVSKVVIEGYTDNQGKAAANRKLSQARADAVKARLVEQGVAPERLEAKGFGPDKPIQSNKTAKGREANRRVEFVIPAA